MSEDKIICQFCGRQCKNKNSLVQHEIRCKQNPDHIECFGNKGNVQEHYRNCENRLVKCANGDILDITQKFLREYREKQTVCEICGKTVAETTKWESKYKPKQLSIDHDHNTKKIRGLLCQCCNRQLGWYEKNKDKILSYLLKTDK